MTISLRVADVCAALDQIAPLHLAASWDNVGLIIGSSAWSTSRALLTIDLTQSVLREAIAAQCNMVVSYHPPIFHPLKSVTDRTDRESIALLAAQHSVAVYSPHTALDAAPGGINDVLAQVLGAGDLRALTPHEHLADTQQAKIVTFAPADAVENIRNGLASVGAGRIGNYEACSFEITGAGTFLPGESARPAVGSAGVLNRVNEVRLEMVCPRAALGLAVLTLREFHPYEEPPIEIYPLLAHPLRDRGQGRRLVLDAPQKLSALVERIKNHLKISMLSVAPALDAQRGGQADDPVISHIGMCAGAGGELAEAAMAQGCQAFFTGEMRHHDVLAAQARGCTVILAGHTNTERPYLRVYRDRIRELLPGLQVEISAADAESLREM